jgi:hypothetical protein
MHTSSLFFLMLAGALLFLALLFHAQHQQPPDPILQEHLQQPPPPQPQETKQAEETGEVIKEASEVAKEAAILRTDQEKGRIKKWVRNLAPITTYRRASPTPPVLVRPILTQPLSLAPTTPTSLI